MWWLLFQTLVLCAVIAANFFWWHLHNPYLVGITGVVAAYLVTVCVFHFSNRRSPL
jgi:hypothetical protein